MRWQSALVALAAFFSHGALGHGEPARDSKSRAPSAEEKVFGRAGEPHAASRTINVEMSDKMRFSPSTLHIREGETVRFLVKNAGKLMHEMVIGTREELKAHAELMRKHPGMEHDAPYMAHVGAGRTGTLVWQFTRPGEFFYGCLVPGHFEAGMMGRIVVTKGASK